MPINLRSAPHKRARNPNIEPGYQPGVLYRLTPSGPAYQTEAETVAAVIAESGKAYNDAGGRPLPLVAHWASEYLPMSWQLAKIADGWPLLPHMKVALNSIWGNDDLSSLASAGLPLTLVYGGQWELDLYSSGGMGATSYFTSLSDADTGQTVESGGRTASVSPMGTTGAWTTLGENYGNGTIWTTLQSGYASPPKVFIASNNEAQYLNYRYADNDTRYVSTYGSGRTLAQKASDFHYRYIERFDAFFDAFRAELPSAWESVARFIGYEAVGPRKLKYYREWPFSPTGAKHDALIDGTFARLRWQPYVWEGEVAELYDNHWEWNYPAEYPNACKAPWLVWSPQNEACNWKFSWDIAYAVNPNFWPEMILWDGELWNASPPSGFPGAASDKGVKYAAEGIDYTAGYYKGWSQYCMWLLKPRVAREFRTSTTNAQSADYLPRYQAVIDMVAHVHQEPTLRRFWRNGTLLEHPTRQHPFEDGTEVSDSSITGAAWNGYPKWYHLPTSADPTLAADIELYTNNENVEWPVYALGHVIGTTPNREWLIYAHSTGIAGATLSDVVVTIPGYDDVTLPTVSVEGAFYYIKEAA